MSYNLSDTNDEARHWLRTAISYKPKINDSNIFEQINLNELALQILYYPQISQLMEQNHYKYMWETHTNISTTQTYNLCIAVLYIYPYLMLVCTSDTIKKLVSSLIKV